MDKFKIGDDAWSDHYGRKEITVPCPVCYGKKTVILILGNGDQIETPCDYCGKGWQGPRGFITEYQYVAEAKSVHITRIEQGITAGGVDIIYQDGSHIFHRLFSTREDAIKAAELRRSEIERDEATRAEYIKAKVHKDFSWNVGYHLREAKRCRENADRHERMAKLCKDRVEK